MIVIYTKILLFQNVLIPPPFFFSLFKKCKSHGLACMVSTRSNYCHSVTKAQSGSQHFAVEGFIMLATHALKQNSCTGASKMPLHLVFSEAGKVLQGEWGARRSVLASMQLDRRTALVRAAPRLRRCPGNVGVAQVQ